MQDKKYKVIIDTDPGVDDSACLIYAFFDEQIDIKLITTVAGNVDVDKCTRNLLHLLDLFNLDYPVAQGKAMPMTRQRQNAEFIHQKEGLGGYVPPQTTKRKAMDIDGVTALYNVLKDSDGDITLLVLGPQTNIGYLLKEHPEIAKKIPAIYFMGGSPFGHPDHPDHISFNIACDPEAFQIVLDSDIPLYMIPSNLGRRKAHLDEQYVNSLLEKGDVGKLLHAMYSKYWEPSFPDKRVATNDTCALFALTHPEMFSMHKIDVEVDLEKDFGKTFVTFTKNTDIQLVNGINRTMFFRILDQRLNKIKDIKLDLNI